MEKISIDKITRKRVNAFAMFVDEEGARHPQYPKDRLEWVDGAVPPDGYSVEEWNRKEIEESPYVVFERKPDYEIERQTDTNARDTAQRFLDDTDYLFSTDRHARLLAEEPEREAQLRANREAARQTIRTYKAKYPPEVMS